MIRENLPPDARGIDRVHARNSADLLRQMHIARYNLISHVRDAFLARLVEDLVEIHDKGGDSRFIKPVELDLSFLNKPAVNTMSLRLLSPDSTAEPLGLLYIYVPLPNTIEKPHEYYYDQTVERPGIVYFARAAMADGEERVSAMYGVAEDEYFKYDMEAGELYRFRGEGFVDPAQLTLEAFGMRFDPRLAEVIDLRIDSQNFNADKTYGRATS